ncbi:Tetraspanin-5, partial [Eschrichtius robustus]|nr:Tetraspanin-5 [Eschrichtius robustus]
MNLQRPEHPVGFLAAVGPLAGFSVQHPGHVAVDCWMCCPLLAGFSLLSSPLHRFRVLSASTPSWPLPPPGVCLLVASPFCLYSECLLAALGYGQFGFASAAATAVDLEEMSEGHKSTVKGVLSNISSITDLGGFDPVWLFLVVGGVMFILGFAGCIGALRENTFLLKFFSVFLGIIFFLELTAGVLAFVFKDWIKDQLYFFINNNIRAYRDDIDLQNLIDFTQEYWQCCGAFGADDWNLNIYFNCTDSNASRERCGVPFSCCTKDPAEDVINTQCGYDARQKPEVDQQIVIYTKGCVPQFEKWLQDNLTIVAGIFIGIALLQ